MKTEPVLLIGLVHAIITGLVSFHVLPHEFTQVQIGAIDVIVTAVAAILARAYVSPVG